MVPSFYFLACSIDKAFGQVIGASQVALAIKNLLTMQETWFDSWVGRIPWRREWQPTPVFLPGESRGQRSLAGCSLCCFVAQSRHKWSIAQKRVLSVVGSVCVCVCARTCAVTHSCPTHCDPLDCSPPGSSVHGILQARILEWVAISFSRGSSQPRDQTRSPVLQADSLLTELQGKP